MADRTSTRAQQPSEELLDALLVRGHAFAQLLLGRHRGVAGGISPVQLQALTVLAGGDVRMHELAHRLGLATSTVTRLVDRLERAGLAERRRERPDRRSVLVGLSTPGRQALHAVRKRLRELLGDLLAGLPAHDQGEFLRLLTALVDGLHLPALEPLPAGLRTR